MSNHSYAGYSQASSRFIGKMFNGITVVNVLRKNYSGLKNGRARTHEYIALCRLAGDPDTAVRVIEYNHVVQAAAGNVRLDVKYRGALVPNAYGLVYKPPRWRPTPPAQPDRLVASIVKSNAGNITSATGSNSTKEDGKNAANANVYIVDETNVGISTAIRLMGSLVAASKEDVTIRQFVKLIASTL
jgi:hypothetical protein